MLILIIVILSVQAIFIIQARQIFAKGEAPKAKDAPLKVDEHSEEMAKMQALRKIELAEPLSEKTRPETLSEIIGQEKGIRALKAALCGPNPQHVIIYGPPGVGKTAAARIILEEAKQSKLSPFLPLAKFIEIDATTLQFDDRSVADPLIGSVHDPIYQGAGKLGQDGIPQPKAGAVTKAHGGILFIDEIGELPASQINKLLKVLEDRKVFLNSSYYREDDKNIPSYIHDIFAHGYPADFRLIGATTRAASEIPLAIRSRCTEIFFRELSANEIVCIVKNAFPKIGMSCEEDVPQYIGEYAKNGREAINITETAMSIASLDARDTVCMSDVEWVLEFSRYTARLSINAKRQAAVGVAFGLAVAGESGLLLQVESMATHTKGKNAGKLTITGAIEEEEITTRSGKLRRSSNLRASVSNAVSLIEKNSKIDLSNYNIHINFPGGMPVDGPSAGIAIYASLHSAIFKQKLCSDIAMTGELSLNGDILPVGSVFSKIEGAVEAGIKKILIPSDNWQSIFSSFDVEIIKISTVEAAIQLLFPCTDSFVPSLGKSESSDLEIDLPR